MKKYIPLLVAIVYFLTCQTGLSQIKDSTFVSSAKDKKEQKNSVITTFEVIGERDTLFRYKNVPFGYYPNADDLKIKNEKGKNKVGTAETGMNVSISAAVSNKVQSIAMTVQSVDQSKSVGEIPFNEGNTPSGGKTYSIPIITAPVASLAPQVALAYNSQGGNGNAGFGWNMAGLSAITVQGQTNYYDNNITPVDFNNPSSLTFSLDGVRLVTNTDGNTNTTYQYETAQGFILVRKNISGNNVAYFQVAYPNGSTAIFGFTTNTQAQSVYPVTSITDVKGFCMNFEYIQSGNNYYH